MDSLCFVLFVTSLLTLHHSSVMASPINNGGSNFNNVGGGGQVLPQSTEDSPGEGQEPQPYGATLPGPVPAIDESGSGIISSQGATLCVLSAPHNKKARAITENIQNQLSSVQTPLEDLGGTYWAKECTVQQINNDGYISVQGIDRAPSVTNDQKNCSAITRDLSMMATELECYAEVLGVILKNLTADVAFNSSSQWGQAREYVYQSYENITIASEIRSLIAALPCPSDTTVIPMNCSIDYHNAYIGGATDSNRWPQCSCTAGETLCCPPGKPCREESMESKMTLVASYLAANLQDIMDSINTVDSNCLKGDNSLKQKRRRRRR